MRTASSFQPWARGLQPADIAKGPQDGAPAGAPADEAVCNACDEQFGQGAFHLVACVIEGRRVERALCHGCHPALPGDVSAGRAS